MLAIHRNHGSVLQTAHGPRSPDDHRQAQRQTLDSLKLDEKLRETVQALGRERAAREEEHRENAHIQAQLLRRIEELERLLPSARDLPVPDSAPAAEPQRPSFGWLKRR